MEYNIAWEIFMTEEQNALKKAVEMGLRNYLTQCIVEMTPQKEVELQKLANQMSPVAIEAESDVMKKYTIDRLKAGQMPSPQTPQEEAELQKMLDAEQLERQKQFSEKAKEQEKNLEKAVEPLAPAVEKKTVWKIKEEVTK